MRYDGSEWYGYEVSGPIDTTTVIQIPVLYERQEFTLVKDSSKVYKIMFGSRVKRAKHVVIDINQRQEIVTDGMLIAFNNAGELMRIDTITSTRFEEQLIPKPNKTYSGNHPTNGKYSLFNGKLYFPENNILIDTKLCVNIQLLIDNLIFIEVYYNDKCTTIRSCSNSNEEQQKNIRLLLEKIRCGLDHEGFL